jgi:hypothetical protein
VHGDMFTAPLLVFEWIYVHRCDWVAIEDCPCAVSVDARSAANCRTESNKGPHVETDDEGKRDEFTLVPERSLLATRKRGQRCRYRRAENTSARYSTHRPSSAPFKGMGSI